MASDLVLPLHAWAYTPTHPHTCTHIHILKKHTKQNKVKLQNRILSLIPIFIKHVFQILMYIEIIWRNRCEFKQVCITFLNEERWSLSNSSAESIYLHFASPRQQRWVKKAQKRTAQCWRETKGLLLWLLQAPEENKQHRLKELGT